MAHQWRTGWRRFGGATTAVAIALVALAGCSSKQHSVETFCSHYRTDKAHYLQHYNAEGQAIQSQSDSLTQLIGLAGMSAQMLGSVEEMFIDLADVAPSDIQPQVEQVRDALKQQQDALGSGSLLSALATSLITGLGSSASWQQVGDYIKSNCHTT